MDKKPNYTVSDEVIAETERCKKGFSCLKEQGEALCPVESCINGKVLFVKCLNKEACPYQDTFGDSVICHCPTRKELYIRYGV